jgi:CheY-like chemotaxis protein
VSLANHKPKAFPVCSTLNTPVIVLRTLEARFTPWPHKLLRNANPNSRRSRNDSEGHLHHSYRSLRSETGGLHRSDKRQEAIEKALAHKPDVVILDINMPLLGGFSAAREIQRLLPGFPILFFTMHTGEQFVLEARKAGVQGFVAKDRAGEILVDAVKALLRNETYF